jgi:Polyketide cyclase / dehydrase and lipid transport
MLKWTGFVAVGLVVFVTLVAVIGLFLPKGHRASRAVVYDASPALVFAAITDFARFPEWRTGVKAVEILSDEGGRTRFREDGPHGPVTFMVEERRPESRLVTRIDDPSLPFGGRWTLDVRKVTGGTELTITEDGEIYNPIFRVLSKVIFSPYETIDTYQADLRKRLTRM